MSERRYGLKQLTLDEIERDRFSQMECDLAARVRELEAEVQHWKANHADLRKRNAVMNHRPDIPVDNKKLADALADVELLRAEVARMKATFASAAFVSRVRELIAAIEQTGMFMRGSDPVTDAACAVKRLMNLNAALKEAGHGQ